ncbi:MAG: hypothetical protein K8W52_00285 [Deltaproteobacteria bacterium]|nr:hypothetical protein [Deltaproteobacteria bacterium]
MVRARALVLALALIPLVGAAALAQPAKKPAPVELDAPLDGDAKPAGDGKGDAGTEVQLSDDDAPSGDPTGTKENPDAPRTGDETPSDPTGAPAPRSTSYPIEEVKRPLTLPTNTSEISLGLSTKVDRADAEGALRARYGITKQAQVGLAYNIGGVFADGSTPPKTKFNTGKTIAVEGTFLVEDWLAARIRVPMYMQPFAIGLELGAPMKFHIGDRLAIVALDDLVSIKLHAFAPSIDNEHANQLEVLAYDINSHTSNGTLAFRGGVLFQQSPKLVIGGTLAMTFPDFKGTGQIYPMFGLLQYSMSRRLDLGLRLGFDSLATANTFGLHAAIAFRI